MAISRGGIAFVGYNADGNDNIAFVVLQDIAAGEALLFGDNEWDGAAFNTGEGLMRWTATAAIPAGTVVRIDNLSAGTLGASHGTVVAVGARPALAAADEVLYAYQDLAGTLSFVTAVANSGFDSAVRGVLTGTGLTAGVDALNLATVDAGADIGAYTGARSGLASFDAYRGILNNAANWITQDAAGDQGIDGVAPDVPFDNTAFTVSGGAPSVTLTLSTATASETAATVVTLTATASAAVVGDQTVNVDVSGSGITAGDYLLSSALITIAGGATSGTATFTIVDDTVSEGPETATLALSGPSTGIVLGSPSSANVAIEDNDAPPQVNLSLSAASGSEAAATTITVTATATQPVVGDQTVLLSIGGSGITASDYWLSNATITIRSGQTTGSVSFTINDDAAAEGAETALLSIGSPSSGLTLGPTTSASLAIANNDGSLLTKVGSATSATASEIPAFDPGSDRVYVVAGSIVNVYQMDAGGALASLGSLAPGFAIPPGKIAAPNSVAIKGGIVAVAYELKDSTTLAHQNGRVSFFNAADGSFLNSVEVGALPDMLSFTPDGLKVLVANEGEPNSYGQPTSFDPEGSISIIDLAGGVAAAMVSTAGFADFNDDAASLKAAGVRIFGPGASVAQDLEPEYITITPDGATAIVTLQEANAVAVLDIASATVTSVLPLGTKDHNASGNGFDASDRDLTTTSGRINIQNWPVQGMLQPDAITNFSVGGQLFFVTANEGDSRAYTGFSEEIRVGAAGYVLDPTIFPDAATLKANANLGRLQLSNATGDTDGDGDFDVVSAFGARSFTIWDAGGNRVFDSGDQLEQITATRVPTIFNSDGSAATFDTRSDNKGPEPEAVVTGQIGSRMLAFVGLERVGDVIVFDVTNPAAPSFVQYINLPEDVAPEGLVFVSAADSPTGQPLLITANEISNTVAVFEIAVPLRIAQIQGAAHISPLLASATGTAAVRGVEGIVTAIGSNGFWIQDPLPDGNNATSEAIFVFTGVASPIKDARTVGEAVRVSGTVTEFRPGGNPDNLTITEIVNNAAVQLLAVEPWPGAPGTGITPTVINVDRTPPTSVINDDGAVNVETGGDFDPANDGIDFWESLEGMQVQVNAPTAVSPTITNGSSQEIWVVADAGAAATGITERGGIGISAGDFNPERNQLDDMINSTVMPAVDVGAKLGSVVGIVHYDFENFELLVPSAPAVVEASTLAREVTDLAGGSDRLRVATFNVENLDPGDGAAKFSALAQAIVTNLRAPEIVNLEEVQDNNGATNNGVVDADLTLQTLVDAIVAAGGPRYEWRQINPANNQDGGEPGGNIRVVFLFDAARVGFVESSLARITDTTPGDGDAFANSRKPLVGTFTFNGEAVTLIGNHFNSKGGDGPLFGPTQPPVLGSEVQRVQQATIVKDYVQGLLGADPEAKVLVLGDLNDFEFSPPLTVLESAGLTSLIETLPANQRYTYNFEGNAQALDHIMASGSLTSLLQGYDVVHINSEFDTQVSDHDPVLAQFLVERDGSVFVGTSGRDTIVGTAGADTITGGPGRDTLTGGASGDRFVYRSVLDAGDLITDFQLASDRLVIEQLLTSVGYTGTAPVADGYLSINASAARTLVLFDADGSAGGGAARTLVELVGVNAPSADVLLDPNFGL